VKIKILNFPDFGQNAKAWENSRPNEKKMVEFYDIIGLDLPVNEFAHVNLFIESSVVEREIFTTLRNHIMWAQTSRVQNVLEFDVADHPPAHTEKYESIRERMVGLSKTERQDEYRLELPIISLTRYSVSMTVRGIVKAAMYFEYLSKMTVMKKLFKESADELYKVLRIIGVNRNDVSSYKLHKILSEDWVYTGESSTNVDGVVVVTAKLPFHLRAQLVRHRGIGIQDNLFGLLQDDSIWTKTFRDMVTMTVYGTENDFKEVISKRSCWVAHYGAWSRFLGLVTNSMSGSFLPCASGSCPFHADALLRFEGKDPNPPCPIHCDIMGLSPSDEQVEKMRNLVVVDRREIKFWFPKIEKVRK
jgi:hypothetical protein